MPFGYICQCLCKWQFDWGDPDQFKVTRQALDCSVGEKSYYIFFKMQVIFWIHHYSQDRNKVSNILLCRTNQDPPLSFPPTYSDCTRRVPLLGCQTSSGRRTKINMRQWCHPSGTMASCQNKALGILLTLSFRFPASFCPLSLSPLFRCSLAWKRSGSPKDKFLWFLWKRVSR